MYVFVPSRYSSCVQAMARVARRSPTLPSKVSSTRTIYWHRRRAPTHFRRNPQRAPPCRAWAGREDAEEDYPRVWHRWDWPTIRLRPVARRQGSRREVQWGGNPDVYVVCVCALALFFALTGRVHQRVTNTIRTAPFIIVMDTHASAYTYKYRY